MLIVKTILAATPLLLLLAPTAMPQAVQQPSPEVFTGKYVMTGASGDLRFDPNDANPPILEVSVVKDSLEVLRRTNKGDEKMALPLDGTPVSYNTIEGYTTTARIKIKGKHLEIERDTPLNKGVAPKAYIHSVEQWTLSSGATALKICGHADSLGGILQFRKSGCQTFKRR